MLYLAIPKLQYRGMIMADVSNNNTATARATSFEKECLGFVVTAGDVDIIMMMFTFPHLNFADVSLP
jgi:hypothetical protein